MLIDLHRRALEETVTLAAVVQASDLGRPSPCAGWTLHDLLAHMVGQNLGFADAVLGGAPDAAAYAQRHLGDDHVRTYAESADSVARGFVRAAHALPGGLDAPVYLAEVRGGTTVPLRAAVQFHLVDSVAHGWDIARSLGRWVDFDDDVLTEALRVAEAVPAGARSIAPGAPFRPAIATSSEALLDRVVATLGRDPAWAARG